MNNVEGLPNQTLEEYTTGSAATGRAAIRTPVGFSTAAYSARLHKYQNHNETKPVGVPGTTYVPHESDEVRHSVGGHFIIMGNAPGSETVRIQSKKGSTVELDADGAMKLVSPSGMHISVGTEGQIVVSGDLHIVAGGDLSIKCGNFNVDCADMNLIVGGNKVETVHGDVSAQHLGDNHTTVQGHSSTTIGGDARTTIAGDHKAQVAGNSETHTTGNVTQSTKGNVTHEAKGNMDVRSEGTMSHGSKGAMSQTSESSHAITAKGTMAQTSEGAHTLSTKSTSTMKSESGTTVSSKGSMAVVADGATSVAGSSTTLSTSSDGSITVSAGSGGLQLNTTGTVATSAASGLSTSHSSSTQSAQPQTSKPTAQSTDAVTANVAQSNTLVPEKKDILDITGDAVATNGEMIHIINEQQIYMSYKESDDPKEIPEKVKSRAKELGMDLDAYEQKLIAEITDANYDTTAPKYSVG